MKRGYSWYIILGGFGFYPNENLFTTYDEALDDALVKDNTFNEIGINYCETDGFFVTALEELKAPTQIWWANNHEKED